MIRVPDDDLDALCAAAKEAVPRLRDLRTGTRRRFVRATRDKVRELVDRGWTDPDDIAEAVETHLQVLYADESDPEVGNPFLFAIIASLVHWLVLRLLDYLFNTKHTFQRYGVKS